MDLITHLYLKFKANLTQPTLKLGHGWDITVSKSDHRSAKCANNNSMKFRYLTANDNVLIFHKW